MNKFVRWSGIVHTTLSSFHPKLKLGQARELFAAALGHNSYASLREHDLHALETVATYVVLDHERALRRAVALNVPLSEDQWWTAHQALTPARVSLGRYIGGMGLMRSAACHLFEDTSHPLFHEIANAVGMKDGHRADDAVLLSDADTTPDALSMLVRGDVRAFNEEGALATPVIAEIRFPRVGRQLYGAGTLVHAAQNGVPRPYEPNFEGDIYGA
ncbi:hypothetical protein GPY61_30180 [Massilia sp. NEAU-DD11]|uniref:Uncharacterized protein n=1 Tax=Massilia cellulosiltytica TaxID=2683234 RepID=A0A7X3G5S5_9BURK|nr:hypothetical protein [Telluria cellulosilytica]MVW64206.1 hypothetical protein [Telluria cellulosilytica]